MKKGRKKAILALLVAGCILTACQGRSAEPNEQTEESIVEIEERPTFDWKKEKWNTEFTDGQDYTLYPEKTVTALDCGISGVHTNCYVVNGSMAYNLNCYYQQIDDNGNYTYYLNSYNLDTGEETTARFEIPELQGYEGLQYVLLKIDFVNEDDRVLFIEPRKDGENQAYLAVHVSADNTVKSIVDLRPGLVENGVRLDGDYGIDSIYADSQGLYYAYNAWKCIVLNENGETILCMGDGKPESEGYSFYEGKTSDGSVNTLWRESLIQKSDDDAIFTVDKEKGIIILAQGEIPGFEGMVLDEEKGYAYYMSENSSLCRWDLISGAVQLCVDMKGEGVNPKTDDILLALNSSGLPIVLAVEDKMRIHATSATPVERSVEEVHIVDMLTSGSTDGGNNSFASTSVTRFAKHNVDYKLTVDSADTAGKKGQELYDTKDSFRTKKLNEIVAGDMPDILFLNKEDFLMLSDKDIFADLTEFYNAELLDGIFTSSQQGGVIDGKQYAIIPEVSSTVLFVDKEVWDKDSWTLEEAVNTMKQNKQYSSFLSQFDYDSGAGALLDIFLYDLDNTPFLDLKNGTCDFTNPLFIELLQYYKDKDYFYKSWETESSPYEECAGFIKEISDYPDYAVVMADVSKKYRAVGLPSENGKGYYWSALGYVVVSKDALNKQGVKDFLKYLLSTENQRYSSFSVRNDLLDQYATYFDGDWDSGWKYMTGNGYSYRKFAWKEDGSSYASDYVALMESCTYPTGSTEDIKAIIEEEMFEYFNDVQSVENAAKVIQSRVQLYLDERE